MSFHSHTASTAFDRPGGFQCRRISLSGAPLVSNAGRTMLSVRTQHLPFLDLPHHVGSTTSSARLSIIEENRYGSVMLSPCTYCSAGQCLGCHGTPTTKGMVIHGLLLTTQSVHAGNSQAFGCGVVSIPIGNEFIRQIGSSSGPLVAIKVGSNLFGTSSNMTHLELWFVDEVSHGKAFSGSAVSHHKKHILLREAVCCILITR